MCKNAVKAVNPLYIDDKHVSGTWKKFDNDFRQRDFGTDTGTKNQYDTEICNAKHYFERRNHTSYKNDERH